MDTDEEMSRQGCESKRDAGAPSCHKCHQSETQAAMPSSHGGRLAAAQAALRTQPRRSPQVKRKNNAK